MAAPQDSVAERFRLAGLPTFANQTDALAALAQLVGHVHLMRHRRTAPADNVVVEVPPGDARFLTEADSLAWLAANGLPVVPHVVCRSEDDARHAFRRFDGAVAMKACSADVPHKSDVGLVVLDVHTEADVARAFAALTRRVAELGLRSEGVVVARMVRMRRELALGGRIDPTFGPVVMVSDGGRDVETLHDFALLLPPFGELEARDAWRSLRMSPHFDGLRGEPPLDLDALSLATVQLGRLIAAGAAHIASVDLNPVMVGASGDGVIVVDALLERAGRS